ncbi:GTP-binding protein [Sulfurimonas gotlandica GD1]|uniref:Ribosome-binding ATPase YchF n=1 Tax=Sulfurimonas gotlandica (strain DSM 19862 / JCM 16533 / GD1) TaxID=929558 RepID=B6BJP7_SULGG|nr:redox-regulated ATPase YchF [Sulfurimonas gotlandica]EDZ62579.1 GTP-binding protein YchF [Sulfurimonas gotlandica GD1]EHP31294.1 GTP-binding protein [Sulfurimonas gotlandica GD1]
MGLSIGLVGLPNVGKSTTFNALTKAQNAEAANYPFCTIEPNKAVVPVPDKRLAELAKIVNPERIQYSTLDFVDIAGLVKGASKGEGLGNKFLSNIRETEVILQIVRCFEDENIVHTEGGIDPLRDVEIIEGELILADIEVLSNRIDRLKKQAKADKNAKAALDMAEEIIEFLADGNLARNFKDVDSEIYQQLNNEVRFLTQKEIMYGANTDEDGLLEDNEYVVLLREHANKNNCELIKLCAKVEEELIGLDDDEAQEFLTDLGVEESGLEQIIHKGFDKLGLMSYFTAGVKEVRAWTIRKNSTAPRAAAAIHNDFEKGFIRAEVISYNDYIVCGGEGKAKEAGKMRLEGKEYIVQDGDVMHFRFNV